MSQLPCKELYGTRAANSGTCAVASFSYCRRSIKPFLRSLHMGPIGSKPSSQYDSQNYNLRNQRSLNPVFSLLPVRMWLFNIDGYVPFCVTEIFFGI